MKAVGYEYLSIAGAACGNKKPEKQGQTKFVTIKLNQSKSLN